MTEEEKARVKERIEKLKPFYDGVSSFARARILATDSSIVDRENATLIKEQIRKKARKVFE